MPEVLGKRVAKIDVIMPFHNYGSFLAGCVDSVTSQLVIDLRIFIIDNASSEDSIVVARALAAGRDMAQAGRLLRTARRGLAEAVCRSAPIHLLAGNAAAADLARYVLNWRDTARSEVSHIAA